MEERETALLSQNVNDACLGIGMPLEGGGTTLSLVEEQKEIVQVR